MSRVIGLSMSVMHPAAYRDARDALSQDWVQWLQALGAVPLLIPNTLKQPAAYAQRMGVDALVLTGAGDARAFGDERPRDLTERALMDWAVVERLPVLGVCRGMQWLNLYFGGGLWTPLPGREKDAVNHVGERHALRLDQAFWGRPDPSIRVNSFHNDGIDESVLAAELKAVAWAPDGVIEAVTHAERPVMGVQWHPERANEEALVLDDTLAAHVMGPA